MIQLTENYRAIVQNILQKYPYTFYAYGSRVKGKSKLSSDLDLCFVEPIPFNVQGHIEEDFEESDLPFQVDVVDYNLMQEEFRRLIRSDFLLLQASERFLKIEKNLYAKFCYLPEKMGFDVQKTSSYTLINSKRKTSTFNIICDTRLTNENINDQIQGIVAAFNTQPFAWWLGPSSQPILLRNTLETFGFKGEATEYAMWLDLPELNQLEMNRGLQIKKVESNALLLAFASIMDSFDKNAADFYRNMAPLNSFEDVNYALFVGYFDGKPIAMGSLFFTENLAGVFDLITLADFRGKGFGKALLLSMLRYAKNNGYQQACLLASSDSGFRLYQKLGFKVVGLLECFEYHC